jgi:hypothetical protein
LSAFQDIYCYFWLACLYVAANRDAVTNIIAGDVNILNRFNVHPGCKDIRRRERERGGREKKRERERGGGREER